MSDKRISERTLFTLVAVLFMLSMSACSSLRPNARIFNQVPAGAPAVYKQGWKDGCESGMALTGNALYKAAYQNKIRTDLVNNTQYYRGWNEARVYCAHYTMATQWEAGTLPKTPTEERTLFPEPQGIFAVMASIGQPVLFDLQGVAHNDEGSFGLYQ